MKLLWVVQRFGQEVLGGSEVAGREFARQMLERGHEVTILTSCALSYSDWANHFPPGESVIDGLKVIRLPVAYPRPHGEFGQLHNQVLSEQQPMLSQQQRWSRLIGPDLVNYTRWIRDNSASFDVAIFKAYLYATATRGIPAAYGRVPILFNPEAHPEEMLNLSLFDSTFRLVDAFQFHSHEEAELVLSRFGIAPRHEVVGIGLKSKQYELGGTQVLERLGLDQSQYLVIVGRVDSGKGTFEAISHFNRYRDECGTGLKLVLVGEHPNQQNFGRYVIPTGFVTEDEKRDLIGGALCLVQPSYLESFSIVMTEAWALGRPVLAREQSRVLRGQVTRARGGLLFSDYQSFREGIRKFESDAHLGHQLGSNGLQFVSKEYSWTKVINRFEDAITKTRESHQQRFSTKYRHNPLQN